MQILIPMAAPDSFFDRNEFHFPKPLVEIDGAPMISWVVEPMRRRFPDAEFIFLVRAEDCRQFDLDGTLRQLTAPGTRIIPLDKPTRGAVCSCLMAIDFLDPEGELIIANGDQVIEADLGAIVHGFRKRGLDAGVIAFDSVHPRWSYIRADGNGEITEAAEKRVISRLALAGFYYYAKSRFFVEAAMNMIRHDAHVNGSYYVAPTLNEMILANRRLGYERIEPERHHSFYSPQKVEQYERHLQNRRIAGLPAHPGDEEAHRVNVVIPMAGRGSRFADAGYTKPKPFIDVAGRTMIERVMENLALPGAHYVLLAQRAHLEAEPEIVRALERRGDVTLLPIDFVTEGAACTVLLSRRLIDDDTPLLIANCDQIVDFDCADYLADCAGRGLDGSILVFRDSHPKWSFARVDDEGLVQEVREKVPISDLATVGLYYFRKGRDFVASAIDMIARNDRTNNEFYTCPVYNHAIAAGRRFGVYEIAPEAMHGTGTPEDLARYLRLIGS